MGLQCHNGRFGHTLVKLIISTQINLLFDLEFPISIFGYLQMSSKTKSKRAIKHFSNDKRTEKNKITNET